MFPTFSSFQAFNSVFVPRGFIAIIIIITIWYVEQPFSKMTSLSNSKYTWGCELNVICHCQSSKIWADTATSLSFCVVSWEACFQHCVRGPGAVWVGFMRQNVWDAHSGDKSLAAVRRNLSMVISRAARESINVATSFPEWPRFGRGGTNDNYIYLLTTFGHRWS